MANLFYKGFYLNLESWLDLNVDKMDIWGEGQVNILKLIHDTHFKVA